MLTSLSKQIKKAHDRHAFLSEEAETLGIEVDVLVGEQEVLTKSIAVMRKAAKLSQEHIAVHLAGIVTKAIRTSITKPYVFHIEFVERRNVTEADVYVTLHGNRANIMESTGGGMADICSFALKVAYLLLSNANRVLIIDEIARHVNSPQQRKAFASVVKALSREFDIQIIITTTLPEFLEISDNIIQITQDAKEISHARVL